jgi:putative flippase GtrA
MKVLLRQGWRYLLVGGTNTAITFALLVLLANFINHSLAFTIVFALGVAYTTALSGRYVFASGAPLRHSLTFVLWYVAVYFVGLGVINVLDSRGTHSPVLIALASVGTTAPLGFIGGRLIFYRPTQTQVGS